MIEKIIEKPVMATLVLIALAIAVIGLIVATDARYDTVEFLPVTYDTVVDVLTPILFVALLVERALEVFVSTGRKLKRVPLERRLQKAKQKVAQLKERIDVFQGQLDAPGASDLTDVQRQAILDRKDGVNKLLPTAQRKEREAQAKMEKYRGETGRVAYVFGSLFGLVIGLAGLRVLAPLVDINLANWAGFQTFVFHGVDVILTAALLAGGASGIHQIISVFSDYTAQTRRKAQAQ